MVELFKKKEGTNEKNPKKEDLKSPEIDAKTNIANRRVKILEERYNSLREMIRFTDQSQLNNKKKIESEIKAIDDEISELSNSIAELKEKFENLSKEIRMAAKENDLKVIEKYLDMWEPVEFVTRKEAADMIKSRK